MRSSWPREPRDKDGDKLLDLQAMDKDGNGFLDTGEFRDAMQKLGMSNITGTTVSTILTAMNIHGPITMEEFLQIVDVRFLSA